MWLMAQTSMYWIGIGKQIEDHVLHCVPCQIHSRSQQEEPGLPVEVPSRPWQKLKMDLFFQGSHWYVFIADNYSKYPWIKKLEVISSKEVISALKFCFFQSLIFLKTSSVTIVSSSLAQNTKTLQQRMDSS